MCWGPGSSRRGGRRSSIFGLMVLECWFALMVMCCWQNTAAVLALLLPLREGCRPHSSAGCSRSRTGTAGCLRICGLGCGFGGQKISGNWMGRLVVMRWVSVWCLGRASGVLVAAVARDLFVGRGRRRLGISRPSIGGLAFGSSGVPSSC